MQTSNPIKPNPSSGSLNKESSESLELQALPTDSQTVQGNFLNKISEEEIEAVTRVQELISRRLENDSK